jgi:hypothetical protein
LPGAGNRLAEEEKVMIGSRVAKSFVPEATPLEGRVLCSANLV